MAARSALSLAARAISARFAAPAVALSDGNSPAGCAPSLRVDLASADGN